MNKAPHLYFYRDLGCFDEVKRTGADKDVMFIDMERNLHVCTVPTYILDMDPFCRINTFKGVLYTLSGETIGSIVREDGTGIDDTPYNQKTEPLNERYSTIDYLEPLFKINEEHNIEEFEKKAHDVFKGIDEKRVIIVYVRGHFEKDVKGPTDKDLKDSGKELMASMAVINVCRKMRRRLIFMHYDEESSLYKAQPILPFYKY